MRKIQFLSIKLPINQSDIFSFGVIRWCVLFKSYINFNFIFPLDSIEIMHQSICASMETIYDESS